MTRSILCALLALISVGAMSVVPVACQSGGVGDPCTPEDEYDTQFPGFKVQQENIESRSFQCATRICLVNHFQGRVSCPRGQGPADIVPCNGPGDTSCGSGVDCVPSQTFAPECVTCKPGDDGCVDVLCPAGLTCDAKKQLCVCTTDVMIGKVAFFCDNGKDGDQTLKSFLCHKKNDCQVAGTDDATDKQNTGKQCCIPGTDTPVGVEVCGQCTADSNRNADKAVYCSCRCRRQVCTGSTCKTNMDCGMGTGVCGAPPGKSNLTCFYPDKTVCGSGCAAGTCDDEPGDPADTGFESFNFCSCPSGFSCNEVRKNVGLGDPNLTGSYCIKDKSAFISENQCTTVRGNATPGVCTGTGAPNAGP
jgi:hypothetical protein